ncbi:MAG: hypothetical protein DRN81_05765 [Thermoproteota archaeon]|nr:MAG: hypothetical protein DRN81_05765 [Candidatus Korarchaeota archaeon]
MSKYIDSDMYSTEFLDAFKDSNGIRVRLLSKRFAANEGSGFFNNEDEKRLIIETAICKALFPSPSKSELRAMERAKKEVEDFCCRCEEG